jgi:type II secretory pathway pseudopilin PulG
MKSGAPVNSPVPARNSQSGFTLAEVLAALLFMAIVVPVAIEGLHIAGLAGAVAERKGEAARIAQRVLTENLVTTNWSQSVQSGTTLDGQREFRWTLRTDQWTQDPAQTAMRQLSVQVEFTAQDRKYYVNMSTLVDSSQLMGGVSSMR